MALLKSIKNKLAVFATMATLIPSLGLGLKSIKSKLVVFTPMARLIPSLGLGLRSIKSKLVVFATMATLIPSLGLGLLTFRQSEAQINANVTRELRALTDYAGREIEFWLDRRVHEAHVTAASGVVIEALSASYQRRADMPIKYPGALARYLQSVQGKLDTIRELTVMNASGKIIASSAEKPVGATLPSEWPQNSVTEGLVIAPPSLE